MLKILRKSPIKLSDLSKFKESELFGINPRHIRTVLDFDGSMTKFVMNMSQGQTKPLVKMIEQKEVTILVGQKCQEQDTLVNLQEIFYDQQLHNIHLIQRSISFNLISQKSQETQKLLYFARSLQIFRNILSWNKQKYSEIMQKNKDKPIGLNLIEQKVQLFRQINWTGICDLEISQDKLQKLTKIHKNLFSRSYTMINNGQPLCELQQFFLPSMFDMFTQ